MWYSNLSDRQCSHDENFKFLNRKDNGSTAVSLLNPQTIEFQVVRTSLLPGLLKTIRENRALPLPMKVFEVSDICLQDPSQERKARNDRRMAGVFMDKKAGFEMVHGLLDRVMQILGVPFLQSQESKGDYGYYIAQSDGASPILRPITTYLQRKVRLTGRRTNIPTRSRSHSLLPTPKNGVLSNGTEVKRARVRARVKIQRGSITHYRSEPQGRPPGPSFFFDGLVIDLRCDKIKRYRSGAIGYSPP